MKGFIYLITNNSNGKQYIGQTIQDVNKRFDRHCQYYGSSAESNMAIKRAIHKYGRDNFTVSILEECEVSLLDEKEIYYIKKYNTFNKGYNATTGGHQGRKKLKLEEEQKDICSLYQEGFSLRYISKEYNVDKQTIKHIIELNNLELRNTRTYKLSQEDRQNILDKYNKGVDRKELMHSYNISKSYLSQLINGYRRI